MYLNVFVALLQSVGGIVWYLREHRQQPTRPVAVQDGQELSVAPLRQHKDVREHFAPLLGQNPSQYSTGGVTYDLRRLTSTASSHASFRQPTVTASLQPVCALPSFAQDSTIELFDPGLAIVAPKPLRPELPIRKTIRAAEAALDQWQPRCKYGSLKT